MGKNNSMRRIRNWGNKAGIVLLAIMATTAPLATVVSAWQTSHLSIPFSSDSGAFRTRSNSVNRPPLQTRSGAAASSCRHPKITMYVPANTPMSQPPSFVAQKMMQNPGVATTNPRRRQQERIYQPTHRGQPSAPNTAAPPSGGRGNGKDSLVKLSNSVLASCDTLPSFPTAHGLLSPETVMRLDETHGSTKSEALRNFLDTYTRKGPLSCLPMLSDPDVLPYLTEAMRDIAA